jgi:hypothetical protein
MEIGTVVRILRAEPENEPVPGGIEAIGMPEPDDVTAAAEREPVPAQR